MSWQLFERYAAGYQHWYETARGRRIALAEQGLLAWLLRAFPGARSILDVGCGSGLFTRRLAGEGFRSVGLDRSPAMLGPSHGAWPKSHRKARRDRKEARGIRIRN